MQKLQGIAQKGGQLITTAGRLSSTKSLISYPLSTITVYKAGTTTLSSIYSDNAGTVKANPFTSGSDASFSFYAPSGRYDVKVSGTGVTSPFTLGDYIAFDPATMFVDATQYGIKGDASTDDTVALQAGLDALTEGKFLFIPAGYNCSITSPLTLNGKINTGIIGGLTGDGSAYAGRSSALTWNGSANKIMLQMMNSNSCVIKGLQFNFTGSDASKAAGYGIFTGADYPLTLIGVVTTATSTSVTFTGIINGVGLVESLPNGDLVHKGRQITIPGAGPSGATLITTIAAISDGTPPGTLTLAVAASTSTVANTATIPTPYGSYSSSSHIMQDLEFSWSGASTALAYRTGICNDLYSGSNHERIRIRDVTVFGNGGALAPSSSSYGIGISFGGFYDSGSVDCVSPLSGYGGGSNVLECHMSDLHIYGVSFGVHGAFGCDIDRMEGSYNNVALFGSVMGSVRTIRFENTRQHFHGFGGVTFIQPHVASFVATVPVFEIYGGSTVFGIQNQISDIGTGALGGTKLVKVTTPTVAYGYFSNCFPIDTALSIRAGTDFTGFQVMWGTFLDEGVVSYATPWTYLGGLAVAAGLPAYPNGTILYSSDAKAGTSPATASSTGAWCIRQGSVWRALGNLSATTTYDPGNLADGAAASTTVTVTGALVGDPAICGFTSITTSGWELTANVTSSNVVTCNIRNRTGGAVDLASGTLRATVLQGG